MLAQISSARPHELRHHLKIRIGGLPPKTAEFDLSFAIWRQVWEKGAWRLPLALAQRLVEDEGGGAGGVGGGAEVGEDVELGPVQGWVAGRKGVKEILLQWVSVN